jgi:hypothetical protein
MSLSEKSCLKQKTVICIYFTTVLLNVIYVTKVKFKYFDYIL